MVGYRFNTGQIRAIISIFTFSFQIIINLAIMVILPYFTTLCFWSQFLRFFIWQDHPPGIWEHPACRETVSGWRLVGSSPKTALLQERHPPKAYECPGQAPSPHCSRKTREPCKSKSLCYWATWLFSSSWPHFPKWQNADLPFGPGLFIRTARISTRTENTIAGFPECRLRTIQALWCSRITGLGRIEALLTPAWPIDTQRFL